MTQLTQPSETRDVATVLRDRLATKLARRSLDPSLASTFDVGSLVAGAGRRDAAELERVFHLVDGGIVR